MSIRPVDKIPKASSPKVRQRDLIRADLNEALTKRISKFEFIGDHYNYKYLAQTAREEVGKLFRHEFTKCTTPIQAKLKSEFNQSFFCSAYDYVNRYITIHANTQPDRIHVYAEIHFDFIDNMSEILETELRANRKV